jgi:endonuclease YncB( thermonuclease family)
MFRLCSWLALTFALLAVPAAALTVTGEARVVDGDTLVLAGERVRLFGIDAPELDQSCTRDGRRWACGNWARDELRERIRGQRIACAGRERDGYGRLLAVCEVGGQDLNRTLVRDGVAFAYRRYSQDYARDEARAERAGLGLWAGQVVQPEVHRQAQNPLPSLPQGCAIKGNVSSSGRIYHRPGQRDYDATRIDPSRGERWFCSAQEAEAAGWRAARR